MKKTELTPPDLMTLRETHAVFSKVSSKVSYPTVWKWARDGHLPTVKIGPRTFVLREAFLKMFTDPGRRPAA